MNYEDMCKLNVQLIMIIFVIFAISFTTDTTALASHGSLSENKIDINSNNNGSNHSDISQDKNISTTNKATITANFSGNMQFTPNGISNSDIRNMPVPAGSLSKTAHPSGMVICSKGAGIKWLDIFMNKGKAKRYAYKVSHIRTKTLAIESIIDAAVGYVSSGIAKFLGAEELSDYVNRTIFAHEIRHIVKHHKGLYIQEPVNHGARIGLQSMGQWNGTTKQAYSRIQGRKTTTVIMKK